jgi:hypothetical protein
MAGIAYYVLERVLVAADGDASRLAAAVGSDRKGTLSVLLYAAAVPLAFVHEAISDGIYVAVAIMWLVPDRRIESRVQDGAPRRVG